MINFDPIILLLLYSFPLHRFINFVYFMASFDVHRFHLININMFTIVVDTGHSGADESVGNEVVEEVGMPFYRTFNTIFVNSELFFYEIL